MTAIMQWLFPGTPGMPGGIPGAGGDPVAPPSSGYVAHSVFRTIANDSAYLSWPVMCRLDDGRILLAYHRGTDHNQTNDGFVVGRFSSDEGETWGSEFTIYDTADRNHVTTGITQVSSGRIYCATQLQNVFLASEDRAKLVYSDDNGATWSGAQDLHTASGFTLNSYGSGPVREATNGDLFITVEGINSGENITDHQKVRVLRSTDDGATWSTLSTPGNANVEGHPFYEGKLVHMGGTNWLCMLRTSNGPGDIQAAFSTDDCATWTTPTDVFPGHGAPETTRISNGDLLTPMRRSPDAQLTLWCSRDGGATWVEESVIDMRMFEAEYGYALELPDSRILIVYGSQTGSPTTDSDILSCVMYNVPAENEGFETAGGTATITAHGASAYVNSGLCQVRCAKGVSSGHWYAEFLALAGDSTMVMGLVKSTEALTSYPGHSSDGYGYFLQTGDKYNGSGSAYAGVAAIGDVIGVEYNSGVITFWKNGVSLGTAFSGVTGTVFPAWGPGTSTAKFRSATVNLGDRPFVYGLPSGASAWKDAP